MAKALKAIFYKNIASVLSSDNVEYKTSQNIVLFDRVLSTYPSKSIYCLVASRLISFIERNINSVPLIIEIMRDEGEDEEIITNIEFLNKNPSIKTKSELTRMCYVLADYVRYAKILKVKGSFIQTLDMIDEDQEDIKSNVETLYRMSTDIIAAYHSANVSEVSHTFDTKDMDAMKTVVAEAKDVRDPNKVIITGIRGLNTLLSPGYLPGYLYIYAALPGNYKSGILLESHVDTCKYNEHLRNVTNGKTPVSMYISMENTMAQTIRRLWGILYPTADMSMFTVDEITEMINNALTEKGLRSVILYYGYREKSTADLANIIRSYNDDENEVVAVYLDYIKRIRPGRTDAAATASEKSELNAIMNELKLIASTFNIPIVSGHQLNRVAQQMIDSMAQNGTYNKSNEVLGRSQVGSAFEVVEVADWLGLMHIDFNGETKALMVKAVKQRDKENTSDAAISGIRHPFTTPESFALKPDIMENVSISIPIYTGKQTTTYMANI